MIVINSLPALATDLVEQLNLMYPARCIAEGESVEKAHRYAGMRDLVEFLLRLQADRAERGVGTT